MTALPEPIRMRPKRLPSAPSISVFEDHVNALKAELDDVVAQYRWMFPSSFNRPRKDTGERVRRSVSGASGDLADSHDAFASIGHQLEIAGDNVHRALQLVQGAGTSLAKAQDKIDKASTPAVDTTPAIVRDKVVTEPWLQPMTPSEAKERKVEREKRVAASGMPWADQEVTG